MLTFCSLFVCTKHAFTCAASRPRLSKTEPRWFVFKTSCYVFCGSIRRFAKVNVNKVNICLLYRINSSCKMFLSMHTNYFDNTFPHSILIAWLGHAEPGSIPLRNLFPIPELNWNCHHCYMNWNWIGIAVIGIAIIGIWVGIAFYRIVFGIEIRYDVPRLISGLTQ